MHQLTFVSCRFDHHFWLLRTRSDSPLKSRKIKMHRSRCRSPRGFCGRSRSPRGNPSQDTNQGTKGIGKGNVETAFARDLAEISRLGFEAGYAAAMAHMGLTSVPRRSQAAHAGVPYTPPPGRSQAAQSASPNAGVPYTPPPDQGHQGNVAHEGRTHNEYQMPPVPTYPSPIPDQLWYPCHYWPHGLSGNFDCGGWAVTSFRATRKTRWSCLVCKQFHEPESFGAFDGPGFRHDSLAVH